MLLRVLPSFHSGGGRRDGGGEARLSRSQRGRQIAVASSVGERWRYLGPAVPRRARERPTGDVCARARRQSAIPPHAVRLREFGLKLIACRRLRVYDPMVTRSSHASSHFFPSVFNRVQGSHRADATSRQALRRELDAKPGRRGRQSAYSMSVARQTSTPSADPKAGPALATLVWATFAIVPTHLLVRFFCTKFAGYFDGRRTRCYSASPRGNRNCSQGRVVVDELTRSFDRTRLQSRNAPVPAHRSWLPGSSAGTSPRGQLL